MVKEAAKEKSVFDEFTRQYSLSKTLRFKLRPIWNTQQMLDDEKVIQNDELRRKKYEAVKPWFDRLHRKFIQKALGSFKFSDLQSYKTALDALRKDKKSGEKKGALAKEEAVLREEIVKCFDKAADDWGSDENIKKLGLKKSGIGILFEAGVFQLLKKNFESEEGTVVESVNIFDDWDKWSGYFKKFFETRKNFYKSDDTSTAIAYRIVNQNLRRFSSNIQVFEEIKKKIDVSEVEKNFKVSCSTIFSLANYDNRVLQAGIDAYNKIIGGELRGKDEKIRGINELVNKYRQDNKGENMPFLKPLDKQILSEKEAFILNIENDKDLLSKLEEFYRNADLRVRAFRILIADIASNHSLCDLNKIYLSKEALERNASRWFASYESFERDLFAVVAQKENRSDYESLRVHKGDSKISDKDGKLSFPDFIRGSHLRDALVKQTGHIWKEKYYEDIPSLKEEGDQFKQFLCVFRFELEQQCLRKSTDTETGKQIEVGFEIFRKPIAELISKKGLIDQKTRIDIKDFADTTLSIYQMGKYFAVEKRRGWLDQYDLDERFYKSADIGYYTNFYRDAYEQIVRPYNLFRNYLTKKPYDTGKWLLNFENQNLADGWDKNKETANAAVLFEKDGRFYLGVMKKEHMDLFTDEHGKNKNNSKGETYRKMIYKYFPNPSQMIPKCSTQLKEVKRHFEKSKESYSLFDSENLLAPLEISKRTFDLNNFEYQKSYLQTVNGGNIDESRRVKSDSKKQNQIKMFQKEFLELTKNTTAYKSALADWIDFCKSFLVAYLSTATSEFDYSHIKNTEEYESVDQFYRDVEKGSYKVSWTSVSDSYLGEKNKISELYVFEIHNKDWNLKDGKKKEGNKSLHTLYFEQLFSKENLDGNFPFKLNGEAELFFRPKTIEEKLGYKVWDAKARRWVKVDKKEKGAVVDGRRYATDTLLFHCPITLNRVSENKTKYDIDTDVRKAVVSNSDVRILGIDRGEKHLAYYSVVDQKGKILETGTLNAIGKDGEGKPVEYATKLEKRAQEREASRRDWKEVEAIKDLKRGYISQVVRKLAELIIQYNAIIVLEDLSTRFKQVRGGIEKSVYQQLERALIDKLSFLVKKGEKDINQAGHILRAYQLAAPITAFKDMGKQTGVIFYTQAGYTSKTCPECGYRRNIKSRFESIAQARKIIESLDAINYDSKADAFTIRYSLNKFFGGNHNEERQLSNELYAKVLRKNIFTLTTKNALRYKWYSRYSEKVKVKSRGVSEYKGEIEENETKKGVVKEFNLTEYIKGLLDGADIDYWNSDIKEKILSNAGEKELYENFLFALFLLTETRHSISGTDTDYIQCPECKFDSRKGFQEIKEFNGDANGAYNIARKGIMILDKVKQFGKQQDLAKMGWGDLSISIEEWDKFTQNK